MSEIKWYEEEHELPPLWGWVLVVMLSASLVGFGWLVYLIVPDGPRHWDFGQLPDTPAESIYSTETPGATARPRRQLFRLPEALPDKPGARQRERTP